MTRLNNDDIIDDDIRDRKSETYHPELPVLWVSTSEEKEDLLSGEEEESVGKFIHRSYFYDTKGQDKDCSILTSNKVQTHSGERGRG